MAAGAWKFYASTREKMGLGSFSYATGPFRVALFKSASNCTDETLSIFNQLTNEIASGNGYSTSGRTLSAPTWLSVAAGTYRFDVSQWILTAGGGTIPAGRASADDDIKFAVVWVSAAASASRFLVCFSTLSTSAFNITDTNTLTITPSANGVFELA